MRAPLARRAHVVRARPALREVPQRPAGPEHDGVVDGAVDVQAADVRIGRGHGGQVLGEPRRIVAQPRVLQAHDRGEIARLRRVHGVERGAQRRAGDERVGQCRSGQDGEHRQSELDVQGEPVVDLAEPGTDGAGPDHQTQPTSEHIPFDPTAAKLMFMLVSSR